MGAGTIGLHHFACFVSVYFYLLHEYSACSILVYMNVYSAHRGQRVLASLELEAKVVASCHVGLGNRIWVYLSHVSFFSFLLRNSVFLCSFGWPRTGYINQTGLKSCTTMTGLTSPGFMPF